MKLEDIVIDFEYAKKLKELRIKQESLFYWQYQNEYDEKFNAKWEIVETPFPDEIYLSAFTSDELLEMLPNMIEEFYDLTINKDNYYNVSYTECTHFEIKTIYYEEENKLSNALAKMLIWLIENDYVKI